jgi:bifunctional DNase/RNase
VEFAMSKPVIEVRVRAIVATSSDYAIFLGNEEKVFVILVDPGVGAAIMMAIAGTLKERPLTHDLLANTLQALGARTERVVVNDLKDDTYFARFILNVENEFQHKIVEIDARPSDCIALAARQRAPIYVNVDVWNEVEDMTEELQKLEKKDTEESGGGFA